MITKTAFTPTGPSTYGSAPGIWRMDEVAYWIKQGVWPNPSIVPDTFFPYVSLLLSSTSLSNANNNLFVDSSGAFNPVSRFGNTTQGSFTPYSTNWSNYFDGSGDYLNAGSNAAFAFGTGDFTVEFWFNTPTYRTSGGYFTCFLALGNYTNSPYFRINQDGRLTAGITASYEYYTTSTVQLNTWTHFAVTRSGSTIRLFVNGVLENTQTNSISLSNSLDTYVGTSSWLPSNETFTGYLSNVRVVKGTAVYTSNFTVPTAPLTAITNTSLLTCQSNRFRDASSNNFTVTPTGNTSVQDFGPFNPTYPGAVYNQSDITNWSGYLDGSSYWTVPTSTALDVWDNGSGSFTVEAWIFATAGIGNNVSIVSKAPNNGSPSWSPGWAFQVFNGYLNVNTPGDTRLFNSNTTSVPLNQWVHCALVKSGSTVSIYQNGVRVGTTTNSNAYSNTTDAVAIGVDRNFAGSKLVGYVSNARMVKGVAVYDPSQSTITVPTTPLTAVSGTSLLTLQNAAFTDNSTNNFVLTQNGNPTVTGNSPFNTVGYWSNYFDGATNQSLSVANNAALDLPSNTSFTIEGWIYPIRPNNGAQSGFRNVVSKRVANSLTSNYNIMLWFNSEKLVFYNGSTSSLSAGSITLNTWTHFAYVYNGATSLQLYINGVLDSTFAVAPGATNSAPVTIGSLVDDTGTNDNFGGYISNIRIVKGSQVYTSNFTVPTAPLTAISGTSLLTCQNGRFVDNSSNAFTVTPANSPSTQSFDPFYTSTIASNGGSMYFDGSGDYLRCPSNPAFNLGTSSYTVEFFIYTSSTTNQMVFDTIQPGISGGGSDRFFVYINTSQQVVVGPATNTLTSSSSIQLGAWNHVAVVRNGTTRTIYINGVSAGSGTQSENLSSSFCTIGFDAAASGTIIMNGYLSSLRVTKGAALYTANFTPPTAPLTPSANTSLLTNGMNAGIYDATTINDMETVGNAQVSTVQSKFGGSSVYFDGSGDWIDIPNNPVNFLGSGDFTVEFWVYGNSWSTLPVLLEYGRQGASNTPGLEFYVSTSGGKLDVYGGSTTGTLLASYSNLPTTTWTHVALTRASGSNRLFINGVQSGTATTDTANYNQAFIRIGAFVNGSNSLNGYIDDLRVTKGVARYTANFTPPTQPFPVY